MRFESLGAWPAAACAPPIGHDAADARPGDRGLLIVGCARREEVEALPPIAKAPATTPTTTPTVVPAGPVDLTPVTLAETADWAGRDLVLADGALYWLTKHMAPAKPCGVAVDGGSLYWIDRGRNAVMRAPLAVFNNQ